MAGRLIRWGWRKREDGFWVVWDLPDGPERVMMVSPEMQKGVDYVERTWGDLDRRVGAEFGIPDGWLQAHEWRESGGNPKARNPEGTPDPGNDGIGLFQITHPSLKGRHKNADGIWLGGYSDAELQDPERNTRIAARYMRDLIKTYGPDFPKISAAFNAGSVHPPNDAAHDNPWNMHQTSGHVTSEVSAYNYWLSMYGDKGLNESGPAPAGTEIIPEARAAFAAQFDPLALEREADDEARRRDTDPEIGG